MPAPTPTSLVDRVDERDVPIGVVPRGRVFAERANFRTAHVFLTGPHGRLLLQRLGRRRDRNPRLLGSSVAAYLHPGESYVEAATRRAREELGVRAPLTELVRTSMPDRGSTKFMRLYVGLVHARPAVLEPEHIESVEFWDPEEVIALLRRSPESFTETFRHLFPLWAGSGPPVGD